MKALIIDDEPLAAKYLKGLIEKYCLDISFVEIINSPVEAKPIIESQFYDIIFLDVEMPEISGLDLLDKVRLSEETFVILTTAYTDYAMEAYKRNVIDYLVKIINEKALIIAVKKVVKYKGLQNLENGTLSIFHNNEYQIIELSDIIRLESDKGYTYITTKYKRLLSTKSLSHYETRLPRKIFARCHHSHIINLNQIQSIGRGKGSYLILKNTDQVPVSSSRKKQIEAIFDL